LFEVNLGGKVARSLALRLSCTHFIEELLNFLLHITTIISLYVHLDNRHLHEGQNVFQLSALRMINLLVDVREV